MPTPDNPPRITVRDIASKLAISHTTVSRSLRNDRRISEPTRLKVQQLAAQMGYRPDPMLAALAHYRRQSTPSPIGAELAWINNWPDSKKLRSYKEFELYWQGAKTEAERSGYRLEEFIINRDLTPTRLNKILLARNIQGILLPPHGGLPLDWEAIQWKNFSVVRFGYTITQYPFHIVTSSQVADGLIAFQNMWRLGYRRIGLVTSPDMLTRFGAGFLFGQWRQTANITIPPLPLAVGEAESKRLALLESWIKKFKPDALMTDQTQIPDLLQRIGCKVPEDIGLATFSILDGSTDAGIDQQSQEIGRAAAQMLISLINHNERGIPEVCRELLIDGRWVDGRTLPPRDEASQPMVKANSSTKANPSNQ